MDCRQVWGESGVGAFSWEAPQRRLEGRSDLARGPQSLHSKLGDVGAVTYAGLLIGWHARP